MNVVIMAGGGGTRLWPLSLRDNPKQFADLGTGKPLLAHAYDRAKKIVDSGQIYVATAVAYQERIQGILPQFPGDHFFLEPSRRDTTAAFVYACLNLEARGLGEEPTTFLWSDHIFTNEEKFISDLKRISGILSENKDSLVIVGHTPMNANTALGYFRVVEETGENGVYKVAEFTEKPTKEKAEEFIAAGSYFWNLGYFSLRPNYLLEEIIRINPELQKPIAALRKAIVSKDEGQVEAAFGAFPKQALEFTFVEKTKSIIAVTGDYGWSDIGNWATVKEVLGVHGDHMATGHHVHVDSENNYVYNTTDKAVSLIGMKDTIVVVTDKAILVADENQSHKVKQAVERIEREGKEEYL